jgi:hypothetical protein
MTPAEMRTRPIASEPAAPPRAADSLTVIVTVSERPMPLDELYRQFAPAVASLGMPYEFIYVVSPWGRGLTVPLRALIAEGAPIRLLEVGPRATESGMLIAGAARATGDILLTLPPYYRVRPEALGTLVERVRSGAVDMATGCRSRSGDAWLNRVQNKAFHALLNLGVKDGFRDIASGVRVFRCQLPGEIALYGDFFRFLPILARSEGYRVEEVVVPQHEADQGRRVYAPGVYYRRLLDLLGVYFLARFTQKPLRFFGMVGSAFGGVGAIILFILFVQRIMGEGISDRPLLLLGVLLFVLGVQAIAIGLVGEIIVHFGAGNRRLYRVREIDNDPLEGDRSST